MKSIAVVGAGTMGAGIAQLAATNGCRVHLIDLDKDALRNAIAGIEKRFARSVEKGRMTPAERDAAVNRLTQVEAIEDLDRVELAIEAVVEDGAAKKKVFAALEATLPEAAVLATNTSSLSVTAIAKALDRPERVIGMHFFNPAPVMPLVEVIAGERSDATAVDVGVETARAWGKVPVRAKDTPGFIVNRVARGYYLEALRLLGEGVAGVDEIDNIMCSHAGFKMGPFQLMDLIGVDVNLAVSVSVFERMDRHSRFVPHEIQQTLVERGYLGRKAGRGFYLYDGGPPLPAWPTDRKSFELSPLLNDALLMFCTKAGMLDASATERYILGRILGAIFNEAGLAYSEGVASSDDIDTAMVHGTNYPRGPLVWADEIEHRTVRGLLSTLDAMMEDGRYAPAPLFDRAG